MNLRTAKKKKRKSKRGKVANGIFGRYEAILITEAARTLAINKSNENPRKDPTLPVPNPNSSVTPVKSPETVNKHRFSDQIELRIRNRFQDSPSFSYQSKLHTKNFRL